MPHNAVVEDTEVEASKKDGKMNLVMKISCRRVASFLECVFVGQ